MALTAAKVSLREAAIVIVAPVAGLRPRGQAISRPCTSRSRRRASQPRSWPRLRSPSHAPIRPDEMTSANDDHYEELIAELCADLALEWRPDRREYCESGRRAQVRQVGDFHGDRLGAKSCRLVYRQSRSSLSGSRDGRSDLNVVDREFRERPASGIQNRLRRQPVPSLTDPMPRARKSRWTPGKKFELTATRQSCKSTRLRAPE